MAFPTNSTVLDNFNRTDRVLTNDFSSGGGQWSSRAVNSPTAATNGLKIVSNLLAENAGSGNGYLVNSFGADTELYIEVPTLPGAGQYLALFARLQNPGSTTYSGYFLIVSQVTGTNNDTWVIKRVTSGTATTLATVSTGPDLVAADTVGFEVLGTGATVTLNAYRKASGGSWTLIGSTTDTSANRITSAGPVCFESGGTTGRFDNLSGGTSVAAAPTGGGISPGIAGTSKNVTFAKANGGISSGLAGISKNVTAAKDAGAITPGLAGADKNVTFTKSAGAVSAGLAGSDKNVTFAKDAGGISSGVAGGTQNVPQGKLAGAIAVGLAGADKNVTASKSGGGISAGVAGTVGLIYNKAGGATSGTFSGGIRNSYYDKTAGGISLSLGGGLLQQIFSLTGGAFSLATSGGLLPWRTSGGVYSPVFGGGSKNVVVAKSGGGISSLAPSGISVQVNVKTGGGAVGRIYHDVIMLVSPTSHFQLNEAQGEMVMDMIGIQTGTPGGTPNPSPASSLLPRYPSNTALSFGGGTTNSHINFGDVYDFAGGVGVGEPFSIEFWMKANTIDASPRYIIDKSEYAPSRNGYSVTVIDIAGQTFLNFERYVGGVGVGTLAKISVGNVYHVVVAYTGARMAIVLNGKEVAAAIFFDQLPDRTAPFVVGAKSDLTSSFDGVIDELAIYTYSLAPVYISTIVADHFYAGAGVNGLARLAIPKTSGATSSMTTGGTRLLANSKNAGGKSPGVAGTSKLVTTTKISGGISSLALGATKLAAIIKAGGSVSAGIAGLQKGFNIFNKVSGALSSNVAGGQRTLLNIKTSGAITTSVAGAPKFVTNNKIAGGLSSLTSGGTFRSLRISTGGATSVGIAGATRLTRWTLVAGSISSGVTGGTKFTANIKTAGGRSSGVTGVFKLLTTNKNAGGISTMRSGVVKFLNVSKSAGSISPLISGTTRTIATVKSGGSITALLAGSTFRIFVLRSGGSFTSSIAGASKLALNLKLAGGRSSGVTGSVKNVLLFKSTGASTGLTTGGFYFAFVPVVKSGGAVSSFLTGGFGIAKLPVRTGGASVVGIGGIIKNLGYARTGGATTRVFAYGSKYSDIVSEYSWRHSLLSAQTTKAILDSASISRGSLISATTQKPLLTEAIIETE